jgi:uncharacterized SAM-binding protein YcdF (DUF218 family)
MGLQTNTRKTILPKFLHRNCKKIMLVILGISLCIGIVLGHWFWQLRTQLIINSTEPVDSVFVLGGSVNREIYAAKIAKKYPQIPILISQGSKDPCILLIFDENNAIPNRVWLEKCAKNTFGNFVFSVPILANWQVKHVKLITSRTHLPRSKWMAQIFFGLRGIWVEVDIAPEKGVPGNYESKQKTFLDVSRSLLWSLFFRPAQSKCSNIIALKDVDINLWIRHGFRCEKQAKLDEVIKEYKRKLINEQ